MGEKSKTIGEYGEKIANRKFSEIYGWNGLENLPFKCKNKKKHNVGKHGIDFFTCQENHLIADTNEMLYISVKNTSSQGLKTKFINYVSDICKAQECFVLDTQYQKVTKSKKSLHQQHQVIIFWLAHDKDEDFSIVDYVGEKYKDLKISFDKIQVVDNKLANFHFLVNTFIKSHFNNINLVEYYYPNTGLNDSINGRSALSGSTLPSHFLNSQVLPYKVTLKGDKKILLLALNEAFEEDSCRRLIGLAQEITQGWCNKIVLCFPNYREQHHKSIKDSVLMGFTEKNFNRMIEVASFNLSYRDFELQQTQILSSDVVEPSKDSEQGKQDFNIEKMLPYGDALRQLLTHSHINKNDLQKILSRRGVFVNKSLNKQDLIPFLTTGFISPNEFEYLRVRHSAKASSEIITSNNIITNEEISLIETIINSNVSIPVKDIIKKIAPNIAIDSIENFTLTDDGRLVLRINTKNRKLTKDWAYSNTNNHTEIVINPAQEYHGSNNARVDVVATSTENKKIGNEIILFLEQYLQKIGLLKNDFALEKALASEFENKSRAKFLFSFFEITDKESRIIEFKDVENVHFIISENNKNIIPEDLKDLKNKVEHSLFSGHSLQDINYIKNEKYHDPLIFTEIHAKFHFKINNIEGEFDIQYGFPDLKKKEANKSEFEFKVTEIAPYEEKILSKKENHILKSSINNEFLKVKQILLDRIDKKHGRQLKLF